LRKVWQRLESNQGLTGRNLQALDDLIRNPRGTALVALPGGWQADRDRGGIRFRKARQTTLPEPLRLRVPGRVSWNSYDVRGRWTTAGRALRGLPAKSSDVEFFAAEGIEGGLEVRVARADERFIPFGRRHSIRIGEFLSKQRVSRHLRIRPAVLADHGGILWVIGVRRSARAMVRATTRRALRVHAESHD
jgi:TilS substrate C-terminal domain